MNWDEILERVKDIPTTRVVVELHKPTNKGFDWLDKEWCSVCLEEQGDYMSPIEVKYPCQTIQAIEKELG
jgi:hypothetical protein